MTTPPLPDDPDDPRAIPGGHSPPAWRETRTLAKLAIPIIATNIGMQAMTTVDTMMVTRIGTEALTAAGIANVWIMGTSLLAIGILMGLDPIVTQAHGAGDGARAGRALQRGLVLSLLIGIGLGLLWLLTEPVLLLARQDPEIARAAHAYTLVQIPTIPFFTAFVALRQYLQGRGILAPILLVTLAANLFNGLFNWVLIFGNLGAPELGLVGAGIATALTRMVMCAGLVIAVVWRGLHRDAWVPWSRRAFDRAGLVEILVLGAPVAAQLTLEISAFGVTTLMAGALGTESAAAHLIVLNMASISFMAPMGISFAAVTRVGNLLGRGEAQRAQHASWVAFAMGAGTMLCFALAFLVGRRFLPGLYAPEPEVLALAATILPIAAAFQVFDGVQVVGGGVLRGMGNTMPAAWFNLFGYYVLALPLAWWMAFRAGLGLAGLWYALVLALATVAVMLVLWVRVRGPAHLAPST